MVRQASIMQVKPGCEKEYQRRHDEIWPEMKQELKAHGVHHYSIFLEPESHQLFSYVEVDDPEVWAKMADTEVCQRWWAMMKEIMPSHEDNSPVETPLKQVFYLD